MSTHRTPLLLIPVLALAATACTANVTTGPIGTSTPTTVASTSAPATVTTVAQPSTTTVAQPSVEPPPAPTTVVVTSVQPAPKSTFCGPGGMEEAFRQNVAKVPAPSAADTTWTIDNSEPQAFDRCAPLSGILLSIKGGTGSSPQQVMLFHEGVYIGTTIKEDYSHQHLRRFGPHALIVSYKYPRPGEVMATATGVAESTYTWTTNQQVERTGELPPST